MIINLANQIYLSFFNFIIDMIKESKYCSHVMKKHFNRELVMSKENDENFESYTESCICDALLLKAILK